MKKFFTLVFATLIAGNMMAQMHGALNFAGTSTANVLTQNVENASDTVRFEMVSAAAGNINVGGAFDYANDNVTYNVRKYMDGNGINLQIGISIDVDKIFLKLKRYNDYEI